MKNNKKNNSKITYLSSSDCCCPVCGSKRIQGISRITGYMTLDERFGEGKVAERKHRVNHNNSEHKRVYTKVAAQE